MLRPLVCTQSLMRCRYHGRCMLQVGQAFNAVSDNQFLDKTLPYLLQAAPFAGVDIVLFQRAMQEVVRDKQGVRAWACQPWATSPYVCL